MTLLRPRPLGDLHLHFLAIGIEKDEIILVDRHFDRIAHDQSFAGISGASPHALAARSVDDVIDLDRENRPAEARTTVEPLIIGNIEELASLLIHGAGPNDRDESMNANRMFVDIAEGLSSKNIVVLRYDKRTRAYASQMSGTDYTLRQETIEDAAQAVALLRKQPEVDPERVYVLGHSLGGYAIPRIVTESDKQGSRIAGAVFLAANARHIEEVGLHHRNVYGNKSSQDPNRDCRALNPSSTDHTRRPPRSSLAWNPALGAAGIAGTFSKIEQPSCSSMSDSQ
jgi:pimeloyl-ACP methyl ester carboxylesterase